MTTNIHINLKKHTTENIAALLLMRTSLLYADEVHRQEHGKWSYDVQEADNDLFDTTLVDQPEKSIREAFEHAMKIISECVPNRHFSDLINKLTEDLIKRIQDKENIDPYEWGRLHD